MFCCTDAMFKRLKSCIVRTIGWPIDAANGERPMVGGDTAPNRFKGVVLCIK